MTPAEYESRRRKWAATLPNPFRNSRCTEKLMPSLSTYYNTEDGKSAAEIAAGFSPAEALIAATIAKRYVPPPPVVVSRGRTAVTFPRLSEAARFIGVSRGAVYSAIDRGRRVAGWRVTRAA